MPPLTQKQNCPAHTPRGSPVPAFPPGTHAGNFLVHHNHIHHVKTFQHGGCGLYYDSGGSGVRWTSNVVHDVVQGALNWNGFGPGFTNAGPP